MESMGIIQWKILQNEDMVIDKNVQDFLSEFLAMLAQVRWSQSVIGVLNWNQYTQWPVQILLSHKKLKEDKLNMNVGYIISNTNQIICRIKNQMG